MAFLVVSVIVQIALIVHALRTGRPVYWVFLLLLFGPIAIIAYLVVELLPELSNSYRGRRAVRGLKKAINPGASLRQHQREHRLSGSVDAARHLAGELMQSGRYEEAIEHYEGALTGLYEHDPDLMLGLAQAQFGNGDFASTKNTLDRLIEHNPDFKSSEGHLLYARAVEACGDLDKALEEYEAVAASYAGAEAKLRYGRLLEQQGQPEKALEMYDDIVNAAQLAPRHYRRAQRRWIGEAKDGIKRLKV